MCIDPISALMIAGTAISAGGQIMSGMQANQAAKYNAAVARNEAEQARKVGQINESLARDDLRRELGRQRAHLARSGVNLAAGSALDLGQDAGQASFMELQSVRTGAESRARSFESDATLSRLEGRRALMSGAIGAVGTMVDGATAFARHRRDR